MKSPIRSTDAKKLSACKFGKKCATIFASYAHRPCRSFKLSSLKSAHGEILPSKCAEAETEGVSETAERVSAWLRRTPGALETVVRSNGRGLLLARCMFAALQRRSVNEAYFRDLVMFTKIIQDNLACMVGVYVDDTILTGPPIFEEESRANDGNV